MFQHNFNGYIGIAGYNSADHCLRSNRGLLPNDTFKVVLATKNRFLSKKLETLMDILRQEEI